MSQKISPFDFINSVSHTKEDLFESDFEFAEKSYNSFIINRGLSYFSDTLVHANFLNQYFDIPSRSKYLFLLNSINKRKRFAKWPSKEKLDESISVIMQVYNYSRQEAMKCIHLFPDEEINRLKKKLEKGGK